MARITVLGGSGFIGSALVDHLRSLGHDCRAPERGADLGREDLGHVVYCIGLTGDWRARPHEAMAAHVGLVNELVLTRAFRSLLYLSSTRVYDRHPGSPAREDDALVLAPQDGDDLYALSKAAGEACVLAAGGRVARLSNVYGAGLEQHAFLAVVMRQAVAGGAVTLESTLDSARDFVGLGAVVPLLARIALEGSERVYNVAGGINVTNRELTDALARLTGCEIAVAPGAARTVHPAVDIARARDEFGFAPGRLLDDLPALVDDHRLAGTARP